MWFVNNFYCIKDYHKVERRKYILQRYWVDLQTDSQWNKLIFFNATALYSLHAVCYSCHINLLMPHNIKHNYRYSREMILEELFYP